METIQTCIHSSVPIPLSADQEITKLDDARHILRCLLPCAHPIPLSLFPCWMRSTGPQRDKSDQFVLPKTSVR